MPGTERRYSRVYWEAPGDERFEHVWWNDHALATWLRLLIAADQSYPDPATYYEGVHRASVSALIAAGLIETVNKRAYRVHGLAAERERRATLARSNALGTGSKRIAAAEQTVSSRAASSSREAVAAEKQHASPDATAAAAGDGDDHLHAWMAVTASPPSARVMPWLDDLAGQYGAQQVAAAIGAEAAIDSTRNTMLNRVQARLLLESRAGGRKADQARKEAQQVALWKERAAVAEMPPEQRAANMKRLRQEMVKAGLVVGDDKDAAGGK